MSSKGSKPIRYDPLFPVTEPVNKNKDCLRDSCKSLFILFLIFLACAPIAFALSTLIFHFYGENDSQTTTIPYSTTTLSTTTSTDSSLPPAASCGKRVVGYYTEWENSEVTEKQLQKLTHVIYLFAAVQENGTIKLEGEKSEDRFFDMKNKVISSKSDLKVMIGVGGHANSPRFGPLVTDPGKRKILVDSIVSFVNEHDLDGVEIFWVWSYTPDKHNHSKFIQELKRKLTSLKIQKRRSENYVISIIVPPSISHLNDGYSLNDILKNVDFLNVLTYDYYFNGNRVGPHSPLHGGTRGNIDETMQYLTCKTRKPSKLNMAVPFYGTFWRNASLPLHDDSDEIWKEIGSAKGPFAVRWNELDRNGWKKETGKFHENSKTSYIWLPETKHFLTFENERSLQEKAKYIKNNNLGGFVVWAIDQDNEENTLLNVVSSADICSVKDEDIVEYLCV